MELHHQVTVLMLGEPPYFRILFSRNFDGAGAEELSSEVGSHLRELRATLSAAQRELRTDASLISVLEVLAVLAIEAFVAGPDLASLSSEADWLAEQRQILEQLSGSSMLFRALRLFLAPQLSTQAGPKEEGGLEMARSSAWARTAVRQESAELPLRAWPRGTAKSFLFNGRWLERRSAADRQRGSSSFSSCHDLRLGSPLCSMVIVFGSLMIPTLVKALRETEADSFRAFLNFLQGADGPSGDLSPVNFLQILHWNQEFGVEHIRGQCEAFLLDPRCREAIELSPDEVLEIAARHNMPKLYEKAVEVTGQGMQYIQVPKGEQPTKFESEDLRTDVVKAHLSMGLMCADGEMRCRHRYADQALLPDAHERARLLWKSRGRFRKPAPAEPDHDWRCPQMVWPHHSFRGEDWTAIASETQPTLPRRSALRPKLHANWSWLLPTATGSCPGHRTGRFGYPLSGSLDVPSPRATEKLRACIAADRDS
ncbi:unnamed protein product [Symbiodinium sp. CCMP2592]|nr:unnamed protein product [Symbiodinium sp. CCMP2592]